MANLLNMGSRFRTIDSELSTIPFDSGNVRSLELPRSFLFKDIVLRLTGSVVVGTGTLTNPAGENPLPLLSKIDIIADGRKLLVSASGRDLYRLCHVFNGKAPELVPPSAYTVGTQTFAATIVISHQALRMLMPADSYFDPRPFEKIELRVTWGTSNALAVNGSPSGGTLAVAAATALGVQLIQTTEGATQIQFNRLITPDETTISASSSNLTINVPRSGLLAGILIRTDRDSAPVDDIINYMTLRSDNAFAHKDRLSWATVQRRNVIDFQLDGGASGGSGIISGYAYLDLTEDGMMSSALNTLDLNVLQLILDVTVGSGTNRVIRLTYLYYEPITG